MGPGPAIPAGEAVFCLATRPSSYNRSSRGPRAGALRFPATEAFVGGATCFDRPTLALGRPDPDRATNGGLPTAGESVRHVPWNGTWVRFAQHPRTESGARTSGPVLFRGDSGPPVSREGAGGRNPRTRLSFRVKPRVPRAHRGSAGGGLGGSGPQRPPGRPGKPLPASRGARRGGQRALFSRFGISWSWESGAGGEPRIRTGGTGWVTVCGPVGFPLQPGRGSPPPRATAGAARGAARAAGPEVPHRSRNPRDRPGGFEGARFPRPGFPIPRGPLSQTWGRA